MEDYRLPLDADGVKYHVVVDEDGQFPGQVLYGLDKNGRLKSVNVVDEGNLLTKVTGSIVEQRETTVFLERGIYNTSDYTQIFVPPYAKGAIFVLAIHDVVGGGEGDKGVSMRLRNYIDRSFARTQISEISTGFNDNVNGNVACIAYPIDEFSGDKHHLNETPKVTSLLGDVVRVYHNIRGDFSEG